MSRLRENTTATLLIVIFMMSAFAVIYEAKSSLIPIQASSETEVSGIITENTIWSDEKYLVTASILVPEGVTLEITPGVSINFQNFFIQIDGTFRVRGVPENKISINFNRTLEPPIFFTDSSLDYDPFTKEGCIIENAIITSHMSNRILIEISYCSPKISSNILTNYEPTFLGIAINIVRSPGAVITNNQIKYGEIGINIQNSDDNIRGPIIAYNTIQNSSIGINSLGGTSIIKNNLITGSSYFGWESTGIATGGSPIITYNVIKNKSVGLIISNHAIVYYNNIYDNENYNAQLSEGIIEDVNVTHNWWGSIEEEDIELKLYDYKDFFRLSNLLYVPFLEEPINETSVGIQLLEPEIESELEPEPPKPAEFVISDLSVSPDEIEGGEYVTFSVKVTNIGEEEGSYTLEFEIDGVVTEMAEVTLDGGESTIVAVMGGGAIGEHTVESGDLSGSFTVNSKLSFWDKIPGFPYESIILGLIAIIIILWRARKKV